MYLYDRVWNPTWMDEFCGEKRRRGRIRMICLIVYCDSKVVAKLWLLSQNYVGIKLGLR